ncbi:MAG: hypothetical protein ACKVZJ_10630 [Phycisphaerales bacterium]
MLGIVRDRLPRTRAGAPAWVRRLLRAASGDEALRQAAAGVDRVHLAVIREPHLARILDGVKTVEARFCRVRRPPMGVVHEGDVVLLKRASGPVVGWCIVRGVRGFDLRETSPATLRDRFDRAMGQAGSHFWDGVSGGSPGALPARFATMIELGGATTLERPIPCAKSDRRGWVVLRGRRA